MLILEFGNCHFGSFEAASEMIRIARECGADAAKGQAFLAKDFKSGSMPKKFYQECAFSIDQYLDLIEIGRFYKIPVFFSCLSKEFEELWFTQKYQKITASQWHNKDYPLQWSDNPATIISVKKESALPNVDFAQVMYATDYSEQGIDWIRLSEMNKYYSRSIGISDHNIDLRYVIHAVKYNNVRLIEKHFTFHKNLKWNDYIFRDTIHGCTPKEAEMLARELSRGAYA